MLRAARGLPTASQRKALEARHEPEHDSHVLTFVWRGAVSKLRWTEGRDEAHRDAGGLDGAGDAGRTSGAGADGADGADGCRYARPRGQADRARARKCDEGSHREPT